MNQIKEILERQKSFQAFVGFPVETVVEHERNELSEKYLFKAIEEIIELRKEFPSAVNPWSKVQKNADKSRILEEFSDVILFLSNFMNVWKISPEELLTVIEQVQFENFKQVKAKKIRGLNSEILAIPTYVSGIGGGCLSPRYVFVGQNPSQDISHGHVSWSEILLPILQDLSIEDDCYLTNYVKCVTTDNSDPSNDLVNFWKEYFDRELEILKYQNSNCKVITMGKWVSEKVKGDAAISHPASILQDNKTIDEYRKEIEIAIASFN